MRYLEHLDIGGSLSVENQEGRAVKHEFAHAGSVLG
jgi:hypothetical protein